MISTWFCIMINSNLSLIIFLIPSVVCTVLSVWCFAPCQRWPDYLMVNLLQPQNDNKQNSINYQDSIERAGIPPVITISIHPHDGRSYVFTNSRPIAGPGNIRCKSEMICTHHSTRALPRNWQLDSGFLSLLLVRRILIVKGGFSLNLMQHRPKRTRNILFAV